MSSDRTTSFIDQHLPKYKFVNKLGFGEIFVQALIWVVLIVITFGLATPFFAYYFLKLIINNTELHEI